ncbi:DUF4136 domain-containing protein [Planctomycetota bacterium]
MKRWKSCLWGLATVLVLTGCSSPYRADYEPDHDFSGYRSYAWFEPNQPVLDALAGNPLLKKRFVAAVNRVLQEQGYALSEALEADFVVNVHGTVQERMRVNDSVSVGYGYYGRYGGMSMQHVDVSYYDEGTLIIDIIDRPLNELVWRGWVTEAVRDYKDPRQAEAAVDKAVRGILANFPPTPVK